MTLRSDEEKRRLMGMVRKDQGPMIRVGTRPLTDDPFLVGEGPSEFSTSTVLARFPLYVWDVNDYYRSLGVHHDATKTQLREAYAAKGGQDSAWLTYCLKQLLDPEVRRRYDASPSGTKFMDEYVMADIKRMVKQEVARDAARRTVQGEQVSQEDIDEKIQDVYRQMGLAEVDDDSADVVDDVGAGVQDAPHLDPFPYSHYQWRTRHHDKSILGQWQELLVRAFSEQGLAQQIAVGVHGRMEHPWLLARVGYRLVVFLHHGETPTADAARAVAARVVHDRTSDSHREILL